MPGRHLGPTLPADPSGTSPGSCQSSLHQAIPQKLQPWASNTLLLVTISTQLRISMHSKNHLYSLSQASSVNGYAATFFHQ